MKRPPTTTEDEMVRCEVHHWFRSQLGPNKVELVKIDTKSQKGDFYTKGLRREPFQHLRYLTQGW